MQEITLLIPKLKIIGIPSLSHRRLRGGLIQYFKILKGFNKVNWVRLPTSAPSLSSTGPASAIRGHSSRLERQIVRNCTPRHEFLVNRIVSVWNSLPQSVIETRTVNSFKAALDKHLSKTDLIYKF